MSSDTEIRLLKLENEVRLLRFALRSTAFLTVAAMEYAREDPDTDEAADLEEVLKRLREIKEVSTFSRDIGETPPFLDEAGDE